MVCTRAHFRRQPVLVRVRRGHVDAVPQACRGDQRAVRPRAQGFGKGRRGIDEVAMQSCVGRAPVAPPDREPVDELRRRAVLKSVQHAAPGVQRGRPPDQPAARRLDAGARVGVDVGGVAVEARRQRPCQRPQRCGQRGQRMVKGRGRSLQRRCWLGRVCLQGVAAVVVGGLARENVVAHTREERLAGGVLVEDAGLAEPNRPAWRRERGGRGYGGVQRRLCVRVPGGEVADAAPETASAARATAFRATDPTPQFRCLGPVEHC